MASTTMKSPESADQILATLGRGKVTGVIRTPSTEKARSAAQAVMRGGIDSIEFTLSIPGALELITEFKQIPGILVGGGTITCCEEAEAVVAAGADYVVCPCLVLDVVKWCAARNVVCMAGVYTPSEMFAAYKAGAHVAKLFPGAAGGPAFVRAVKGPMPFLRVVPTTGATEENCAEYIQAGAFGIGFTGVLFVPDDMANERWDRITARAARMVKKVRGAAKL